MVRFNHANYIVSTESLTLHSPQGNQLCLRTHLTQPPHSVLCATDSHILIHEAGGVATLSGALVNGIAPSNGHHLTLSDIQTHAVLGDEIHSCPTRVISLENTLGGEILPLEECRRISAWARSQDPPIKMHLDGARLWEACVALSTPAESAKDILFSYSACFDSVSLCFSKGLGAPIGSIIVGNKEFVKRARWIRKSIGGGLRQAGVVSAAARVSVEETFLGGLLGDSHRRAEAVGALWKVCLRLSQLLSTLFVAGGGGGRGDPRVKWGHAGFENVLTVVVGTFRREEAS